MISGMGREWCSTFLSPCLVATSPMVWCVFFGPGWREERRVREEKHQHGREEKHQHGREEKHQHGREEKHQHGREERKAQNLEESKSPVDGGGIEIGALEKDREETADGSVGTGLPSSR